MDKYDREKVLDKAADLFREKGYDQTTIHELVTRTGLNLRTIHKEFGSKERIFLECVDCYVSKSFWTIGEILSKRNFIKFRLL